MRGDVTNHNDTADLDASRVWVTGDVLHMSGDAERAASAYLRSGRTPGHITTVDLSAAVYTDGGAVHLILRCLQHQQTHHPGTRLTIRGADDTVRYHLHVLGVTDLLAIRD